MRSFRLKWTYYGGYGQFFYKLPLISRNSLYPLKTKRRLQVVRMKFKESRAKNGRVAVKEHA